MPPDMSPSAAIAAQLTRAASKQTYLTIRTLVPSELRDDAFRAYAYFRWVDDRIDGDSLPPQERLAFVETQRILLTCCFENHPPRSLLTEEWLLVDLIQGPLGQHPGLRAYLRGMMTLMDFDARRRFHRINQRELSWYSHTLATAVTEAVYTFIGERCCAPRTAERYLAADGAHISHMLRDLYDDLDAGYVNIPIEILPAERVAPEEIQSDRVRRWVRDRVDTARAYFSAGSNYLASVQNMRCRVAGAWYAARFEGVLDAIEREGYRLRRDYSDCKGSRTVLRMCWNGLRAALPQSWSTRRTVQPSPPVIVKKPEPTHLPILQREERLHERADL